MNRFTSIQDFVRWGLDREIPFLAPVPTGPRINLGPGSSKVIVNTIGVGRYEGLSTPHVDWWHPDPLPFEEHSVAAVHAHQFLEHFDGDNVVAILREIERVLMPGGVAFITTPYGVSQHALQALDHKSRWTEETWDWLLANGHYSPHGDNWRLRVHACFILGVVYRNLDLFTQLVKS